MGPKNNSTLEINSKFLIKNIYLKTFKRSNIQDVTFKFYGAELNYFLFQN